MIAECGYHETTNASPWIKSYNQINRLSSNRTIAKVLLEKSQNSRCLTAATLHRAVVHTIIKANYDTGSILVLPTPVYFCLGDDTNSPSIRLQSLKRKLGKQVPEGHRAEGSGEDVSVGKIGTQEAKVAEVPESHWLPVLYKPDKDAKSLSVDGSLVFAKALSSLCLPQPALVLLCPTQLLFKYAWPEPSITPLSFQPAFERAGLTLARND
jgi:hypothetical protein